MNNFAIGTKTWARAQRENNRLILDNASIGDIQILAKDNGWRNVKEATAGMNSIIIHLIQFREFNGRKNN